MVTWLSIQQSPKGTNHRPLGGSSSQSLATFLTYALHEGDFYDAHYASQKSPFRLSWDDAYSLALKLPPIMRFA